MTKHLLLHYSVVLTYFLIYSPQKLAAYLLRILRKPQPVFSRQKSSWEPD